jgi:hypothetical protein
MEDAKMAHNEQQTIDLTTSPTAARAVVDSEPGGEGVRTYQGMILDELPGAAFAAATLLWIVSSFARLTF